MLKVSPNTTKSKANDGTVLAINIETATRGSAQFHDPMASGIGLDGLYLASAVSMRKPRRIVGGNMKRIKGIDVHDGNFFLA